MAKRPGSQRWLQRQRRDPYVKQAQQSHYRSRAIYKLIEIDKKDRLFHRGQTVVDLGAAPGSWTQYATEQVGEQGCVVAVDQLILEPIPNVLIIQGDFTETTVYQACLDALHGKQADLVISDLAPNLTGIRATDQARSLHLSELARDFACAVLKPGGNFLVKSFQGAGSDEFRRSLQGRFTQVLARKPGASRDSSREYYVLARSFRL